MAKRKLRKEYEEAQKLVKEAAVSLRKAADRAARVARTTGRQIGRSKEVAEARKQARQALKAIAAAGKVALETTARGAKSLRDTKEVKRASVSTRRAAKSTVRATKTASRSAGAAAKKSAATARRKASAARKKRT